MPHYPRNQYLGRSMTAALVDACCLIAAAAATWHLLSPPFPLAAYAAVVSLGVIGAFATLYYVDAYALSTLASGRRTFERAVTVMGVAFVAALLVYHFVPTPAEAVRTATHTAALYLPLLLAGRFVFRRVSASRALTKRVLLIGTSELAVEIARSMTEYRSLGTELAGFLSDELIHERSAIAGFPVLGKVHQVEKIVDEQNIDHIVVASKDRAEHFPADQLLVSKFRGLTIESGVSFYERISGQVWMRDLRPSYLIFSEGFRVSLLSRVIKRTLDVGISALGLLISAPILALSIVAIRLDSKGSAFYGQRRVGKDAKVFSVLKLRTMRLDAEADTGPVWTQEADDRVTRVGKLLRMTRLDELPQLWNVLKGDMTLVGPRPERPEFVESLSERYPYFALRSTLRPGITGWAQIQRGYVNEIEGFEEKLALDIYYMKYRSTLMDLLILWKTAKTVLLMSGV